MPGISISERLQIVTLTEAGFRDEDMADATGQARSSKNRIVRAYKTKGRLENLPRGHRPRATNDSDDERIVAAARQDPKLTAKAIRNDLMLTASTQVIRERLQSAGLQSCVAAQKPLFSARNRGRRLLCVREDQTWTEEELRSVIFTDESTFTMLFDQQQRIWRTENTRLVVQFSISAYSGCI
ncbi:hypothetical protein HPB48_020308 [Haemaphysalis longicornis]|uniref:Transposase Tc1-like domain-containing protein n=1 Tax=Haemaphysalis longicornis TaxID=44386 RepID=A0A9J6GWE3_HAELO|nr:hypothetical protein HPB48_020308 [Haemaphysalis longicornis]